MIPKRCYIKNFPVSYIDFTSRDIPEKKKLKFNNNKIIK